MRRDTLSALDFVADTLHAICVRVDARADELGEKIDRRLDVLTLEIRHDRLKQQKKLDDHGTRLTRLESGARRTAQRA